MAVATVDTVLKNEVALVVKHTLADFTKRPLILVFASIKSPSFADIAKLSVSEINALI